MSVYGKVVAVVAREQGSITTAAYAISDTVIVVEDATDFDEEFGTVEILGTRYAYDSTVWDEELGTLELTLTVGLTEACEDGTPVWVVLGGEVATDMLAMIDLHDGDAAEVRIKYGERAMWPLGEFDDPIPVAVSDDLTEIDEVMGRLPVVQITNSIRFHVDSAEAPGPGDLTIDLSYLPLTHSPDVKCNGLGQPGTWAQAGQQIIVSDPGDEIRAGDVFTIEYAYQEGASWTPTTVPLLVAANAVASPGAMTFNYPTGTLPGDLLIMWSNGNNPPAGWVDRGGVVVSIPPSSSSTFACFSRYAGTETSVALDGALAFWAGAGMVSIREAQVMEQFSGEATGTDVMITGYEGHGWNVYCVGNVNPDSAITLPGTVIEDVNFGSVVGVQLAIGHDEADGVPVAFTAGASTSWAYVALRVQGI